MTFLCYAGRELRQMALDLGATEEEWERYDCGSYADVLADQYPAWATALDQYLEEQMAELHRLVKICQEIG